MRSSMHFPTTERAQSPCASEKKGARELELIVEDDGKGCPEGAKEGLGSRIVRLLAQQLRGHVKIESAEPGCRMIIAFPAGER